VDLWAAGCVLAEMLGLTPFIPGQSDIDQLAKMQHKLGSITPQNWPGVEQLPDWHKVSFAHSDGEQLATLLPDAPPVVLDLLRQLLCYDPSRRVSAEAALCHKYCAGTGVAAEQHTA
jgi:serine/threonine protein kinase